MQTRSGIDAVFLHATEGIIVVDENGEITEVNPSVARLFGYERHELYGKKIEVLIPKRLSDSHKKGREVFSKKPQARAMGQEIELSGLKKDGTEFPVEIGLSPFEENGKKFVVAFVIDITARKMAEEKIKNYSSELERQVKNRTAILEEAIRELERTKKELRNALAKEKELNELKSRFVSMASHEFRTPLTTMRSSLSLIAKYGEQNNKENQVRHIGKIKSSIDNLTEILNDFLSVSRLEEGKFENKPEEVNLKKLISDVIAEMSAMTGANQRILLNYSGAETVILDPKLIRNILFNLISNAIKFSYKEGQITITADVTDSAIKISVKDSGIGISKQDQEHLFERFFRGHNATNIQGTGLGLNIVAKYAELMNARLSFESEENVGSVFTISIAR